MITQTSAQPPPEPQAVLAPLTGSAIFLVAVVDPDSVEVVRDLCADLAGLVRAVGAREPTAYLTCVTGIGDPLWDTLAGGSRPAGLHPFREIEAEGRHAVGTEGDLFFHIRAARMDLCFELASQLMFRLSGAVRVADEVHGFRYFDSRDVIGFVDGTENPAGAAAERATVIGAEDPGFTGGSYVIVQKYLHDSQPLLERLGDGPLDEARDEAGSAGPAVNQADPAGIGGSLEIGSMKGVSPDE